jgi:uncharacterized protein
MTSAGPDPPRGPGPAFLRRRLIVAGVVMVIATIGALIATWAIQRFVTFPSPPAGSANPAARTAAGGRIVWLDVDGARVEAWLLPAQGTAAALIIYSHGNGELIDMRAADFDALRAAGYAVLQVEYPGYGRSAGSPSEASVTAALVAAYDWARTTAGFTESQIVGYGRSLGGGAIAQLAARRRLAALVLESTFVNLEDVVMSYGVPRALLLYHFDTAAVLRSYPGPVLLIHGTADRVFPVEDARILASTAKHARLHLEDCGHADCAPQWDLVLGFLRGSLLKGPEAP